MKFLYYLGLVTLVLVINQANAITPVLSRTPRVATSPSAATITSTSASPKASMAVRSWFGEG